MNPNRLSSLDDATLRRELARTVADERTATAGVLAHIAEFDARRLYLADACPTMHAYCVQVLHLSDGAAYKRIHAARAARRFPSLFTHLAAGRLHLSAVCLLAPHLTEANVDSLSPERSIARRRRSKRGSPGTSSRQPGPGPALRLPCRGRGCA